MIDSENNILDTNKLYYVNYNGPVQTYSCPSMGTYAYVSQGIQGQEPVSLPCSRPIFQRNRRVQTLLK